MQNQDNHSLSPKRFAFASFINVGYFVITSLVFLIVTPLAIKSLGKEIYGLWVILLAILQFASLTNLGSWEGTMKFVSQYFLLNESRDELSTIIIFSYSFAILTGILTITGFWYARNFISSQISTNIMTSEALGNAIGLATISVLPMLVAGVSKGILLGLVRNEIAGGIETFINVLLWIGTVVIYHFASNLSSLAVWGLLTSIFYMIISCIWVFILLRPYKIHFVWKPEVVRRFIHFSILTWVSSLGNVMFQSIDRIFVGIIISPAIAGAYSVATSVSLRLTMIGNNLAQTATPFASLHEAQGNRTEVIKIYRQSIRITSFVLTACAAVLIVWIGPILSFWISPDFSSEYSQAFRLLILAYAVLSLCLPAYRTSIGLGWVKIPALIYLFCGIGVLSLIWFLGRKFGLYGAIFANFFEILLLLIPIYLSRKLTSKFQLERVLEYAGPIAILSTFVMILFLKPGYSTYILLTLFILICSSIVLFVNLKTANFSFLRKNDL
jgi:O-antigen/teichoic acid export membrane protein